MLYSFRSIFPFISSLTCFTLMANIGWSTTIFEVTTHADAGPGSLREAIANTNQNPDPNNYIVLHPQQQPIVLHSPLPPIQQNVTISDRYPNMEAPSTILPIVDGNATHRIFSVENGKVTIENIVLRNGRAPDQMGGAVLVKTNPNLVIFRNVRFLDNLATDPIQGEGWGNAVFTEGETKISLENCTFQDRTNSMSQQLYLSPSSTISVHISEDTRSSTLPVEGLPNLAGEVVLQKRGTGKWIVDAANPTFADGLFDLKEGTLEGDTHTLNAGIDNGGVVIFSQTDDGTYPFPITGPGQLIKEEAGKLTLTGLNTYRGGTIVREGALQGTHASIPGDIENHGTVIFDQLNDGIHRGNIHGTGSVVKENGGVLTLLGTNSYSGGTTVNQGELHGNSQSLPGEIENHALLVFDTSEAASYENRIWGSGRLIKRGYSPLTLSGSHAQSMTAVEEGKLILNGELISPVEIHPGAALGGGGTVLGDVRNQGIVSPGNSIGTIHIIGDYVQAPGSSLEIEINATSSDQLIASGAFTIEPDATLTVLPEASRYTSGNTYSIVAAGGITGVFDHIIAPPDFQFQVLYLPQEIRLMLQMLSFSSLISDGNPGAVAACLDTLGASQSEGDLTNMIDRLQLFDLATLRNSLDQLHPGLLTGLTLAQQMTTMQVANVFMHHMHQFSRSLCAGKDTPRKPFELWINTLGDATQQGSHLNSQQELIGFRTTTGAILAGIDTACPHNLYVGLGGGYSYTNINWHLSRGKGHIDSYYLGAYGSWTPSHFFLNASLISTLNQYEARRRIEFPGLLRKATSHHRGSSIDGHIDAGMILCAKGIQIRPFGALDYLYQKEQKFNERGAESLNLHVQRHISTMLRGELGLNLAKSFILKSHNKLSPQVKLSWVRETRLRGKKLTASFEHTNDSFEVEGLYPNRSMISPGAGIAGQFCHDRLSLDLFYNGEFGQQFAENTLNFQVRYGF